jgi:hypothetical protein
VFEVERVRFYGTTLADRRRTRDLCVSASLAAGRAAPVWSLGTLTTPAVEGRLSAMIRQMALEYWKRVTAAASAAPWRVDAQRETTVAGAGGERVGELSSAADSTFVAAARDALPSLLAEHDHLVALVRTVGQPKDGHCPGCGKLDPLGHKKRCPVAPYLK